MPNKINISDDIIKELIKSADNARKNAYAPYSHFKVGAALYAAKDEDNFNIITGCNGENASYPAGNCAERTAVFKAVSEGYNNFKAIAIIGGDDIYTSPCGICRQVLREFVAPNIFYVKKEKNENDYVIKTLEELLPMSFGPESLKK